MITKCHFGRLCSSRKQCCRSPMLSSQCHTWKYIKTSVMIYWSIGRRYAQTFTELRAGCSIAKWLTSLQAPKLPVRENDVGQVFVANLTSIPIDSVEDFAAIYSCVLFSTYIFWS